MSKFTFFTILFSLIVILVVGQLVLRDAIFPEELKTNVTADPADENTSRSVAENVASEPESAESTADSTPSPSVTPAPSSSAASFLFDSKVMTQSGFATGKLIPFSGKVFELFDLGTYQPASANSYQVEDNGNPVAIFTELRFDDEIKAQGFYTLIQNKSKVYVDISLNETNGYGDRSFFINHKKKTDQAFLLVRIRNYIYTFAYGKASHPKIKTLISLLYTSILDQP